MAALPLMRTLNTLALGDEYAQQLGIRVESARVWHHPDRIAADRGRCLARRHDQLRRADRAPRRAAAAGARSCAPAAGHRAGGAIFLVVADTLARTVFAPSEVPVGILMAFIGGPFFLYLLRKMKRSYTV